MKHVLKTDLEVFDHMRAGRKNFDVRPNDRNFQVLDTLLLLKWDPQCQTYIRHGMRVDEQAAERLLYEVTFVLDGGQYGIDPGYCVVALKFLGGDE